MRSSFEVPHAGCPSCAERVRSALSPFGVVEEIAIDEDADSARVVMRADRPIDPAQVSRALEGASVGSGHDYRVAEGSWQDGGDGV